MDHFNRLLPNFPKLFDSSPSETKSEAKSEVDQSESVDEAQKLPEEVPLVPSHENLAFEEEEKHLEPKDTSMDSTTSTMDTTLDSTDTGDGGHDAQKEGNHSEISVSHVNGSDVSPTGSEGANDGSDYSIQSFLGNISSFAVQLTTVSAPEIKVDKPKTLFSVATEDSRYTPPPAPSQSPRRHTDHNINTNQVLNKSTLLPEAVTRRRHSDFAVAAPRPINEELAIEDLKKHGTQETNTARKGSHPDVIRAGRGAQWSPSLERKKMAEAKKGKKIETRRKTLAELALEAGYKQEDTIATEPPVVQSGALQVIKAEATKGSTESLSSDHGEEHFSRLPVTGELFVSLRYEMPSKKFEVHVHSANNLACADAKKSSSDPYVKTYLLPDRRSKRKTKTKKDTLNPHFDEIWSISWAMTNC
ncbi:calcium ion-regulated exocytosis of neurotransmitter [Desmophyllum pertusum]|uniref:Calcium ion-regulated exocytosis of neurotransmitter n=1 Tax=Desmophyllum pertusum TaxID=174260 RepID=A0A9W9YRA4_9CNID|nr:calcium ion-regulated exocytosis of neurotransmitter [Desmophyllum pertusum]